MRLRMLLVGVMVVAAACGGGPTTLPLGEQAEVGHKDTTTNTATTLALTVTAVRQGTVEELEASGLQFDEDERDTVPFYVDARYENTGDVAVERTMRVSVEDGDDNLISPVVVLDFAGDGGEQGPCPDINDGELPPGESFEDCTLFLLPTGTKPARVSFLSQPPEGEPDFVYWQAE